MTNYIFPELACYKRDWIPLLEAARELVRHSAVRYVCNALYVVVQSSNASEKLSAQAAELSDYIEQSLGGFHTVSEWFRENHPGEEYDAVGYRLAWIDHIIKECKRMKTLMESLDWKECGYYLVADVGRWRLTVTRGEEVGYFAATWTQRNLPQFNLPNHAAQGATAEEAVRLVLQKAKDHTAAEVAKLQDFVTSMEGYL
jgi:hypothetical protein